ncbi:MAG TPA: hypothetical protein VF329_02550 [Gammaproteobacteria bacterium]
MVKPGDNLAPNAAPTRDGDADYALGTMTAALGTMTAARVITTAGMITAVGVSFQAGAAAGVARGPAAAARPMRAARRRHASVTGPAIGSSGWLPERSPKRAGIRLEDS